MELTERLAEAVRFFWQTRKKQAERQVSAGRSDQGARSAATGGAQMDGIVALLAELLEATGVAPKHIHRKKALELPGYFRPTKQWDLLVIRDKQLVVAIEVKSHVGPSFGNNFNNRAEEAMGSALDLWTAYREGAFNLEVKPWLGYMLLLEDCPESRQSVMAREPYFQVFPEFKSASYSKRYELLCRKLVRERHYNAAAFLTSSREEGLNGAYNEPAKDLSFEPFMKSLSAQATAFGRES